MKAINEILNGLQSRSSYAGTESGQDSEQSRKHATQQAGRVQAMAGQLTGNFTAADEQEAHALFERMHRIYGGKWAATYGRSIYDSEGRLTEDARGWLVTVRKMTQEQAHAAVTEAQKRFAALMQHEGQTPWPPAPLEFYAWGTIGRACLPQERLWQGYADKSAGTLKAGKSVKALTHDTTKRNTEAGRAGLEALKRAAGITG